MAPRTAPRHTRRLIGLASAALATGALVIAPVAAQAGPSSSSLKERTVGTHQVQPAFFCNIAPTFPFICKGTRG